MSWLALDVGGTNMRAAIVSDDGVVGERVDRDTERDSGALVELAREVLEGDSVDGAVIGLPGRIDYGAGTLEYAPNIDASWRETLTEATLSEALGGVPCALANDADLAAVGEAWFGAGRSYRDVAYLTISTGIGAGVVTGGLLVHGRRSVAEVGHTIVDGQRLAEGRKATVEALGSGTALTELAREADIAEDGPALVELVRAGDATATRIFERVAFAAAMGAVNLAHLFTPEVIVVGGGLGLVGDLILEPIRTMVSERGPRAMPEPICVCNAELGDAAGLTGAAAWHRAFKPQAASRAR
ncbi:MAG TPA: ROK family protein [Acidimicrobiales bacterium]|nr:ROK family protein [Acidimicrobiales bacterium]